MGETQEAMQRIWREWRRARRARIGRTVALHTGCTVQAGPFAGLRYGAAASVGSTLAPKLLGTYERELHDVVEGAIARQPDTVLNIGAGEGYYAVGFALRLPDSDVRAWESDSEGRTFCVELAELNGVADRVAVRSACTPAELAACVEERALVVCDVEGYERVLLDPVAVPGLLRCEILAELHGRGDADPSTTIAERFERTHTANVIAAEPRRSRDARAPWLNRTERRTAVDERRRDGLRWLHLLPREGGQ